MAFQADLKFSSFALHFILKTNKQTKTTQGLRDGSVGKALDTKVWGPEFRSLEHTNSWIVETGKSPTLCRPASLMCPSVNKKPCLR